MEFVGGGSLDDLMWNSQGAGAEVKLTIPLAKAYSPTLHGSEITEVLDVTDHESGADPFYA